MTFVYLIGEERWCKPISDDDRKLQLGDWWRNYVSEPIKENFGSSSRLVPTSATYSINSHKTFPILLDDSVRLDPSPLKASTWHKILRHGISPSRITLLPACQILGALARPTPDKSSTALLPRKCTSILVAPATRSLLAAGEIPKSVSVGE